MSVVVGTAASAVATVVSIIIWREKKWCRKCIKGKKTNEYSWKCHQQEIRENANEWELKLKIKLSSLKPSVCSLGAPIPKGEKTQTINKQFK